MVSVERIKEYQETPQVTNDGKEDDGEGDDDDEYDDAVEAYMLSPNHSHRPQAPTLHEDTQTQPHFTRSYSCVYTNTNTDSPHKIIFITHIHMLHYTYGMSIFN